METDQIYSVLMTYHADLEPLARSCDRLGVLYQDIPSTWAGRIRLIGYATALLHVIRDNWGQDEFIYEANGQPPMMLSGEEFLDMYGAKV